MAEHIQVSPDRRFMVFAGNTGPDGDDVDRRHVVKVPVDRATPSVITPGTGLEWRPVVTGDGGHIVFLGATPTRPPIPMALAMGGGPGAAARPIGRDRIPSEFPETQLVVPRKVVYKAPDGLDIHAQLFERAAGAAPPGGKPAVVYVHGGPPRQMLLGWHYSDYYSNAYALNQYLASRGFIVLSINYRLGIGYGYEFHRPPHAGAQGATEYQDVRAAGEYLRTLPQVDPSRIGIYGGSYGGYLSALALARDSGLFAAGVDIHGVHDWAGERARPCSPANGTRPLPTQRRRWRRLGGRRRYRPCPPGSRRCCSSTPTTTATCASRRRWTSCSAWPRPAFPMKRL